MRRNPAMRGGLVAIGVGLVLAVGACTAGSAAEDPVEEPSVKNPNGGEPGSTQPAPSDRPEPTYSGPAVRAVLEVMESMPPQYAVTVHVDVPTGGHVAEVEEVLAPSGGDGDPLGPFVRVHVKLTEPGADELVTEALETLTVRAKLPVEPTAGVAVAVSRWIRGAHYLQAPAHELAVVVEPAN